MKVSIIGLGWFGQALAAELSSRYSILGTTRSTEKAAALQRLGYKVEVLESPQIPSMELLQSEVIVLNIPPKEDQLTWFKSWPWRGQRVIFISSTSVYGEVQGVVDESISPLPDTAGGKILAEQEQFFAGLPQTSIVRFGGLIGDGRHPGKFLSGRRNLEGGERPVNLIHQRDTVGFIKELIERPKLGVFNLVHSDHPKREEYYVDYCRRKGLPLPEFIPGSAPYKKVHGSRVEEFYSFQASLKDD